MKRQLGDLNNPLRRPVESAVESCRSRVLAGVAKDIVYGTNIWLAAGVTDMRVGTVSESN